MTLFGENCARLRRARGFTQKQLADEASRQSGRRIGASTVARIESKVGRPANPTIDVLTALATALEVDVARLFAPLEAVSGAMGEAGGGSDQSGATSPRGGPSGQIDWKTLLHKIALDLEDAVTLAERPTRTEVADAGGGESPGTKAG